MYTKIITNIPPFFQACMHWALKINNHNGFSKWTVCIWSGKIPSNINELQLTFIKKHISDLQETVNFGNK